jgi:endonuclease YncB( thermonuclease family)
MPQAPLAPSTPPRPPRPAGARRSAVAGRLSVFGIGALLTGLALFQSPGASAFTPLGTPSSSRGSGSAALQETTAAERIHPADLWRPARPETLYEVLDVIDGDTVRVLFEGRRQSVRLLSVDTEESYTPRGGGGKPETAFGHATTRFAREYFDRHARVDGRMQAGLLFPGGEVQRDVFGRLLAHVILPDGTDFNLLLVREGWSPYYAKYGYSELCHEAFIAAQIEAVAARRGVWDPATNRPEDPEAPSARQPYERILPWWEARALAIQAWRERAAEDPAGHADAEQPEQLKRLLDSGERGAVFFSVFRTFDEDDGTLTLLARAIDRERPLRVHVPVRLRDAVAPLDLDNANAEYRQNFFVAEGRLRPGSRERGSFDLFLERAEDIYPAGPEPDEVPPLPSLPGWPAPPLPWSSAGEPSAEPNRTTESDAGGKDSEHALVPVQAAAMGSGRAE